MLNHIIIITIASSANFDVLCVNQIHHSNLKTWKPHTIQTKFAFRMLSWIIHNLYNIAKNENTVCIQLTFVHWLFSIFTTQAVITDSARRVKAWQDISIYSFQSLPINLGTLESEATVKILSLVLACGVFSVVMVIAVAVHLLYFEEKGGTVRAVLRRKSRIANIDHSFVWRQESQKITLPSEILQGQLRRLFQNELFRSKHGWTEKLFNSFAYWTIKQFSV